MEESGALESDRTASHSGAVRLPAGLRMGHSACFLPCVSVVTCLLNRDSMWGDLPKKAPDGQVFLFR